MQGMRTSEFPVNELSAIQNSEPSSTYRGAASAISAFEWEFGEYIKII